MTDADRIAARMLGTMIWAMTRGHPAPRLRAASASVATSIDSQAGVDRAMGERQDQDDVDEHEGQRRAAEAFRGAGPWIGRSARSRRRARWPGSPAAAGTGTRSTRSSAARGGTVQVIVGTSRRSMPRTVSAAISSESDDASIRSGRRGSPANASRVRLPPSRGSRTRASRPAAAAGSHRPASRMRPARPSGTGSAGAVAAAWAGGGSAVAAGGGGLRSSDPPRCPPLEERVQGHDDDDDDDHPQGEGLADVRLAEDDLAGERTADLRGGRSGCPG